VEPIQDFEILTAAFYNRPTKIVAIDLLGKVLIKKQEGSILGGMIVETEAYFGQNDPASHAYNGRTPRNEIMYSVPGLAYVYLCYGVHDLFNVVAEKEGKPGAVLIRALEPLYGLEKMMSRSKRRKMQLSNGPGKLTNALGISKQDNGVDLTCADSCINILVGHVKVSKEAVSSGPRVGIKKALHLPLRFYIKDNPFVSRD
jgi:DNA-3-methyladenine glycosylase